MEDFKPDLEQCLRILSQGGVILYPTDTLWGLGCDATNEEAVQKLTTLKGKESNKGLIILLADERSVLQYVTQPDLEVFDYLNTLQKPTTVIYEGGTGVADEVLAADGSIAIRLVKDDFCRHLVKRFRKPIVSTSANFSKSPSPQNFQDVDNMLKTQVDYIVKYRQADSNLSIASSIIKWNSGQPPTIIRP